MSDDERQPWILLIHQLPPKPTNLRVRTWRKLQRLGAVAVKSSVYALPATEKSCEDLQWLKQEIESLGGEAAVFRADSVEGATDEELVASFRRDRDEAYAALSADLDGLAGAISEQRRGGRLSPARLARIEAELGRLHVELERVAAIDFFAAPGAPKARLAYERALGALQAARPKPLRRRASADGDVLDPAEYQGRRWVTRPNLHVDRLASAWLVSRFVDRRPRFHFVKDGEALQDGVRFDMREAEFTHEGEDCTFETMVRRFGLGGDSALRAIAEIVHDVDLKDGKFDRLEAAGFAAVIDGMVEHVADDRERIRQCGTVFDALYALYGKKRAAAKVPPKATERASKTGVREVTGDGRKRTARGPETGRGSGSE